MPRLGGVVRLTTLSSNGEFSDSQQGQQREKCCVFHWWIVVV